MMEKRYSQMNEKELRDEIAHLNEKAKKAEQMGMVNEFAVLERKRVMAEAYLIDPDDFMTGQRYAIKQEGGTFFIKYFNGVFAWGFRNGSEELEALPISLLED
ncbi:YfhH family protein [Alteribacillus sp. YIM 98480]|uniref:YfhH family protein n=1 Tax=Alteribacillus sp. YIM 98480 TaxID=2606599 RepID=UPI00131B87A2|nr:YfhH family protein [Alteribacillus sp. YIM 98480]